MLTKLIHAAVVGILVFLACLLIGALLGSLGGVPIASTVGAFLTKWAYVLGVVFGLLDFVSGGSIFSKFGGAA